MNPFTTTSQFTDRLATLRADGRDRGFFKVLVNPKVVSQLTRRSSKR